MMSLKALNVCTKILYVWYETWICSTRWQPYSPQLLEMLLCVLTHGWTGKALIKSWSYAGLCNASLCKVWKWEWSYELLHFLTACTSIPAEVARCQHYYTGMKMYRKLDRWLHNDVKCSYRSFYVLFNCDLQTANQSNDIRHSNLSIVRLMTLKKAKIVMFLIVTVTYILQII